MLPLQLVDWFFMCCQSRPPSWSSVELNEGAFQFKRRDFVIFFHFKFTRLIVVAGRLLRYSWRLDCKYPDRNDLILTCFLLGGAFRWCLEGVDQRLPTFVTPRTGVKSDSCPGTSLSGVADQYNKGTWYKVSWKLRDFLNITINMQSEP